MINISNFMHSWSTNVNLATPLTIKMMGNGSVKWYTNGHPATVSLKHNLINDWDNYTMGNTLGCAFGARVSFSGSTTTWGNWNYDSPPDSYYLSSNQYLEVCGNIASLVNNNTQNTLQPAMFYYIFSPCKNWLTRADIALPFLNLSDRCYASMFQECGSMTDGPKKLPATTLASECYYEMFQQCSSLKRAPFLPAMNLTTACYTSMFAYCGSLTQIGLPATTLADSCYASMLYGCTSLSTAPALPATILKKSCYSQMFGECSNLQEVKIDATVLDNYSCQGMFTACPKLHKIEVNFTSWHQNATNYWVEFVASNGTFIKPTSLPTEFGDDRIPYGWTVVNKD